LIQRAQNLKGSKRDFDNRVASGLTPGSLRCPTLSFCEKEGEKEKRKTLFAK
jgi:hypothetical protein